jgi:hypothetical protein
MLPNYGDSLLNPPISIAFGPAGLLPSRGSLEAGDEIVRTEMAPGSHRTESLVSRERIPRRILARGPDVCAWLDSPIDSRTLCDLVSGGANSASPRHGRNSQAAQQISCQNYVVVLYLFSSRHPGGDRRADRRFLNRGVSIAGIAPDGKTESPGNGAATA